MKKYICTDGNAEVEISASTAKKAAKEYVDRGEWAESYSTFWIKVYVGERGAGEEDIVKIAVHPACPPCREGGEHKWKETDPRTSGGGIKYCEDCANCGITRTTNTWGQDPADGEQGLYSVSYAAAE